MTYERVSYFRRVAALQSLGCSIHSIILAGLVFERASKINFIFFAIFRRVTLYKGLGLRDQLFKPAANYLLWRAPSNSLRDSVW